MRISMVLLGVGFGGLLACGGSASPPAQTGGTAADSLPAASSSEAPAAEPPSTADTASGIRAFDAGNYAEARKSFEAATKKNPKDYESLFNLGQACEKLGDPSAAETAYKAALAVKPDLEAAAAELAALYVDDGHPDDAIAVARAALAKHPQSAPLHENLGTALAAKGDQDGATKELTQAIQLTPNDAMMHLTLAHWLNQWKVRGAAPHLDAARDLAKDDYGMIVSIGHEYRMAGEFDSCIKAFDRAVAMKDGGEVRTDRALCREGKKDDKGALEDLQAAVAKEPTYANAHYFLGGKLARDNHFKEAAAEFQKYLDLAPSGSLAKPAAERLKVALERTGKKR